MQFFTFGFILNCFGPILESSATAEVILRPEKKCLVSGNPTDPTFLGSTLNFFGTSENFSVFRVF